jgi:hypothetical protein
VTVRPGGEWGRTVERPDDLVAVSSDAEVMSVLAAGGRVRLVGGDLARTVGCATTRGRHDVLELPIDLIDVTIDGIDRVACAHVVVHNRAPHGGWWRGNVIAVMNAEFLGEWDVAPRGHPNDGRVEVVETVATMNIRDRLAVRRRLPLGTHVPHPSIATRPVREAAWDLEPGCTVIVDGKPSGRARSLAIRVRPDAAVVYV